MKKRFFVYVAISHFVVLLSLILPIHRLKIGVNESVAFINFFDYIYHSQSVLIKIVLISLIVAESLGAINAILGIFKKSYALVRNAFTLGFSSAILAAILLSSGSYIFFLVCAASFLAISYFSLRLMKSEK